MMLSVCLTILGQTVTAGEESTTTTPQPRLTVSEDLSNPSSAQGCLSAACEATTAEDLGAFLACFTTGVKKLRKPAAVLFVQYDVDMALVDHKIVQQTGNRAQAAVKYVCTRSGNKCTIFSFVDMQREQGYWKIARESIQTIDHEPPTSFTVSRYSCFGGQCRVAS